MGTVEPIKDKKDIEKIKKILSKQSTRNLLMFEIGINCGLRISDILALKVQDVKNKNHIEIVEKKTKKKRIVPLNQNLKLLIKKYTKNKEDDDPLFKSKKSKKHLDRFCAYKIINETCQKINLSDNFGTHTLRKTFGYHFYKKYKDIAMLQKIFNHSSPDITLRYIGISQEEIYKSCLNFYL